MIKREDRKAIRAKKHLRVRKKIDGVPDRPRLSVYRSLHHIYAQIIDDTQGHTLVAASSADPDLKSTINCGGNRESARAVGEAIAKKAMAHGITKVVFDRGGFIYHGRVAALAEAAREAGLEF